MKKILLGLLTLAFLLPLPALASPGARSWTGWTSPAYNVRARYDQNTTGAGTPDTTQFKRSEASKGKRQVRLVWSYLNANNGVPVAPSGASNWKSIKPGQTVILNTPGKPCAGQLFEVSAEVRKRKGGQWTAPKEVQYQASEQFSAC